MTTMQQRATKWKLKRPTQIGVNPPIEMKRPPQMSPLLAAQMKHRQQQRMLNMLWANAQATNGGTYTNTTASTSTFTVTPGTGTVTVTCPTPIWQQQIASSTNAGLTGLVGPPDWYDDDPANYGPPDTTIRLRDGESRTIQFPDGTVIEVAIDGSFVVQDKDAKCIYRANRIRDFNSFVNASDKLESFIQYCGEQGVRQNEMLDIPVRHFIAWLIVEAAKADGEQPQTALPDLTKKESQQEAEKKEPRCRCGRFMPRKLIERKIPFCRPVCLEKELAIAA